jgi:hypothetical protein
MARRKRRSQKSFDTRLVKELRTKRITFLRELSELVSNAVGIRIRCSFAGGDVVVPTPPKRKGKVKRATAHLGGTGKDLDPRFDELPPGPNLPDDQVGF